ncbi:MAG: AAA family ATPase [Ignavibacteriales bacterium]|nr:AAA family ATPase [Ignavibacteriales bacterium]
MRKTYYVDKTSYIQTLESISDKYIFFLRPRRFGNRFISQCGILLRYPTQGQIRRFVW